MCNQIEALKDVDKNFHLLRILSSIDVGCGVADSAINRIHAGRGSQLRADFRCALINVQQVSPDLALQVPDSGKFLLIESDLEFTLLSLPG